MARYTRSVQADAELQYKGSLASIVDAFRDITEPVICPRKNPQDFIGLTLIGVGATGKIYRARSEELGDVAIKRMLRAKFKSSNPRNRAVMEKMFVSALNNVFVVKGLGTFRDTECLNLVMEYGAFGTMSRLIPFASEDAALPYFSQIVFALEYIHSANVIHADLKPGNVMIFRGGRLKVGDFGLAEIAGDDLITLRGTLRYMAPEIFLRQHFTDAVDWWALGVMLYEAILDSHPYYEPGFAHGQLIKVLDKPLAKLEAETRLSSDAKDLIMRLLERDRTRRAGTGKGGADNVKKHPWFRNLGVGAFLDPDYLAPGFQLTEIEGEPIENDFFKNLIIDVGPEFGEF